MSHSLRRFSWRIKEEIKTNITPDEASCYKQIVGILQPLGHLAQGIVVTYDKLKRGSPGKFDWQIEEVDKNMER